jgi:hypothetical protein
MATPRHRREKVQLFPRLKDLDRHRRIRLALPVRKIALRIPWGYQMSDYDASILEPIEEHIQLLYDAQKQLDYVSYRDIAEWLTDQSGVRLCHQASQQLFEYRLLFEEAGLPREERNKLIETTL